MRERVAVVGAGVSGLTAAYLLQRRYDVTLFEAEGRLGGHAHTHELDTVGGRLRVHRPQRRHLPEPAAAVRASSGSRRRTPR